jgi:hypothetical protein
VDLQAEVKLEHAAMQRITTVARCSSCPSFADILWGGGIDPFALHRNPGVMLESPRRVVVFQYVNEELRYYAGGWTRDPGKNPDDFRAEDERKLAEGSESGVFATAHDALAFSEQYLVDEQAFSSIQVPRQVCYYCEPSGS